MDLRKCATRGLKLLLPNGRIGTVTDMSPRVIAPTGAKSGSDQIQCSYTAGSGMVTEAWFDYDKVNEIEQEPVKKMVTDLTEKEKEVTDKFPDITNWKTDEEVKPEEGKKTIINPDITDEFGG